MLGDMASDLGLHDNHNANDHDTGENDMPFYADNFCDSDEFIGALHMRISTSLLSQALLKFLDSWELSDNEVDEGLETDEDESQMGEWMIFQPRSLL